MVSADYTKVEEAIRFCEETNVDALAVAVGTAHGHYKQDPVLAIDRIRELHDAIPSRLFCMEVLACRMIRSGRQSMPVYVKSTLAPMYASRSLTAGQVDPSIIGVDVFMKEPYECVKRFALEKTARWAQGSNG